MTNWLVKRFIPNAGAENAPAVRQRYGVLSGVVGVVLNLLLTAGKLVAGAISGSVAMTADALNNLTDAGASVVTLAGFRMAAKQADSEHPFGHGRVEYLSGLAVSMVILLVGVELVKTSVEKIIHPEAVVFSLTSTGILLVSILIKLWLSAFNRNLGGRIHSAAMAATATDALSDAAATSVVLAGTLLGHFCALRVDGWLGLLVAALILRAGWGAARDTLDPLLGKSPSPELVQEIEAAVLDHPFVTGVHDLVIHDYGPGRSMMSLHAEVPIDADILAIHDEIDNIERELKERFQIDTVIHMDPIATNDPLTNELRERVATLVRQLDEGMTIHDFRMTAGPDHNNLIFDVVVPYHCKWTEEEVKGMVSQQVRKMDGVYYAVVSIDRAYTDAR